MGEEKKKHLHTFQLKRGQGVKTSIRNKIFRCIDPECWFYAKADTIIGKKALCSLCKEEFVIDRYSLTLRTPHCSNCNTGKKAADKKVKLQEVEKRISKLFGLE